jgi:hypothetical protein
VVWALARTRGDVKSSYRQVTYQQSCSARMTANDVQGRATQGSRLFSNRGGSSRDRGIGPPGRGRSPPYLGGLMEQVILVLGQLSLILAGVVCVVGFVLLIVSMVLTTLRKLLEFTKL